MNISEIFIRRPVMTTLVMIGIVVFGVMAYRLLPVSDLPNVDFPTINVNASLPGASAETMMAQRLSTVPGVAQVIVYGAQKYAVRINLDPSEIASRSLGIDEVSTAIKASNVNLPVGILNGPYQAQTIQANGQLLTADD